MRPGARLDRAGALLWLAAACACLLVGVLASEYHSAVSRETPLAVPTNHAALSGASPAARPVTVEDGAAQAGADDWVRTTLARPIFSPSRRPTAVASTGPRQPRLAGIIIGPSGARAIFAGDDDSRGIVAAVGQQAGDWRVLAIDAASVRVVGPGGLRTLRPLRDPNAHADDAPAAQALPPHPSILDLLRSRPLQIGPPDGSTPLPGLRGSLVTPP